MGRCRAVYACCFAALLLAACTSGKGHGKDLPREGGPNPNAPVQALLRERSERLRAGDVPGYLAALSPTARAFEEPLARGAVSLPLGQIDMTLNDATISDDGSTFRGASVYLTYRFKELPDDNPFRVRLLYDLDRQQDGSWVVIKSTFDRRPGVPPPPPLWPQGPVEMTRSRHFLVMARPGVTTVAEGTAAAEKGYGELLPKLPLEQESRALLVLAQDTKEFQANFGGRDAAAQEQAVCQPVGGGLCRPEERLVMADLSVVLILGAVKQADVENTLTPEGVFQHELAHLALSRFTRACTTRWVVEGGAMFLADEHRTDTWKSYVAGGRLDGIFLDGGSVDYGLANAAVLYLVEHFGAATFFDFYQNFKNLPAQQCSGNVTDVRSRLDERLLRRYYRFGVTDLEGFARDYIRNAVAAPVHP